MSISIPGFSMEVRDSSGGWSLIQSYNEPGIFSDYVNGVCFRPQLSLYALVYDRFRKVHCLLQFANKDFLDSIHEMPDRYDVLQVFGKVE